MSTPPVAEATGQKKQEEKDHVPQLQMLRSPQTQQLLQTGGEQGYTLPKMEVRLCNNSHRLTGTGDIFRFGKSSS
jgi:hypothetical protein